MATKKTVKKRTTKAGTAKRTVKRSTTTKKRTRKSSKTTEEQKKPEIIHPRERQEIKLSSHVYHQLLKKTSQTRAGFARAFLIGEDEKQIARMVVAVGRYGYGGCENMPDLNPNSLAKAYIKLAQKGLLPIGIARTGDHFSNGGHWDGNSGPALYAEIGYILSVAKGRIIAQVFIPTFKGKRNRRGDHGRYYNGDIKELSVLLTDK